MCGWGGHSTREYEPCIKPVRECGRKNAESAVQWLLCLLPITLSDMLLILKVKCNYLALFGV